MMTELGRWLQAQMQRHELTVSATAVYAGVGMATISDIINKGHVPKVETLFRLADYFQTSREEMLRLAGHLPRATGRQEEALFREDEALIRELIAEFRQVPDEWKEVAIQQVAQFRKLAELRPVRVIGDEDEDQGPTSGDEGSEDETAQDTRAA
jgi:transcriptional regulator with XRE-family HTH domain